MKFEMTTPESLGICSGSILEFMKRMEEASIELHSISVLRHGKMCAIGAMKPYDLSVPHIMFSFSKTLTATGIGFAVQEGILKLTDKLIDIFPEYAPENPSENLKKADLYSLLTMSCGHETEIPIGTEGSDWIRSFMHHEFVYEPGTMFLYNTAGTNMLAAALKKRTGLEITEYLKPRLFEPLGMSDVQGLKLPDGTVWGGSGMFLTTMDQALFGQFLLQRGKWEGKQLLNDAWFDQATVKQIDTTNKLNPSQTLNWAQGYCFQCWRNCAEGVYRCDGAYGQFAFICPKQDAVVTITSASETTEYLVEAFEDTILKSMQEEAYPENPALQQKLSEKLENASLPALWGARSPQAEQAVNGVCYHIVNEGMEGEAPSFEAFIGGGGAEDIYGNALKSLQFKFEKDRLILKVEGADQTYELALGLGGEILKTPVQFNGTYGVTDTIIGGSARFENAKKLTLELRNIRCVTGARITLRFTGTEPGREYDSFTMLRRPTLCIDSALHDTKYFLIKMEK